jgi:hypothetical protein
MDSPYKVSITITHSLIDVIRLFYVSDSISTYRDVLLLDLEELLHVDRVTNMKVRIKNENDLRIFIKFLEQNLVFLILYRFK